MATKNKTTVTTQSVDDFIESFVDSNQKKQDSYQLIKLMQQWSGFEAQMWGPSIIGFGSYHYKYASGHEGDAPMIAFSPRKAAISLYVFVANEENKHLLNNLGEFKIGKACMYIKTLSDIDINVLQTLCETTIEHLNKNYTCACKTTK
ncbi:MAG: DUF1801 domain-containing protein [Chitinophagales bacterium]|jgi:hypothetical protein|nr:DUF1801 domain-containing protein [Chitinophagales bacterium]